MNTMISYPEPMHAHSEDSRCVCATPTIAACMDVADFCIGESTLRRIASRLCGADRVCSGDAMSAKYTPGPWRVIEWPCINEHGCPDAWRERSVECAWCGQEFDREHPKARLCSDECAEAWSN